MRELLLRLANVLVLIAMVIFWPVIEATEFVAKALKKLSDALELEIQIAAATRRIRLERKQK